MTEFPTFIGTLENGAIVKSYGSLIGLLDAAKEYGSEFVSIEKDNGEPPMKNLKFMNRALLGLCIFDSHEESLKQWRSEFQ